MIRLELDFLRPRPFAKVYSNFYLISLFHCCLSCSETEEAKRGKKGELKKSEEVMKRCGIIIMSCVECKKNCWKLQGNLFKFFYILSFNSLRPLSLEKFLIEFLCNEDARYRKFKML